VESSSGGLRKVSTLDKMVAHCSSQLEAINLDRNRLTSTSSVQAYDTIASSRDIQGAYNKFKLITMALYNTTQAPEHINIHTVSIDG